jgi:hypothetical protein
MTGVCDCAKCCASKLLLDFEGKNYHELSPSDRKLFSKCVEILNKR